LTVKLLRLKSKLNCGRLSAAGWDLTVKLLRLKNKLNRGRL
jgi:hypothetical protein